MAIFIKTTYGMLVPQLSFAAAIANTNITNKTIVINGTVTLTTNTSLPANTALYIEKGGELANGGYSFTVPSGCRCVNHGVMSGTGALTMSGGYSGSGTITVSGSITWSNEAYASGLLAADAATTATASKIVKADSNGKIDANWSKYAGAPGSYESLTISITSGNYALAAITATYAILKDASNNTKLFPSFSGNILLTTSGAGGLDTGSEAPSTLYHIHLIGKADGTINAVFSTSDSTPSLGSYTYWCYIGSAYNDSSSNLIPIWQKNNVVTFTTSVFTIKDGSFTTSAWTAVDVSPGPIPLNAKMLRLVMGANTVVFGVSPISTGHGGAYHRTEDYSTSAGDFGIFPTARYSWSNFRISYPSSGFQIYYYTASASSTLVAIGYEL